MRMIDANALLRALPDDLPYKGSVRRVLMQAPEVEAVPVVRCMDCRNWRNGGYQMGVDAQHMECGGVCRLNRISQVEGGFCSYGERIEDKPCE